MMTPRGAHGSMMMSMHWAHDQGTAEKAVAMAVRVRSQTRFVSYRAILGRTIKLTEELRRLDVSKCPDRFSRRSRKLACKAYPESLRDIGVLGMGGKTVEIGESLGEGGELENVLTVVAVDGLSLPRLEALDVKNALCTRGRELAGPRTVPNDVEFRPT